MLRFHGSKAKRIFEYIGTNSRLDEIQAAALRIFLRELDGWTALRREAAERYRDLGLGDICDVPEDEPGHVYHLFVSRSPQRDEIRAALTEAGIGSADYYEPPLHLQPALRYLGYSEGDLPETERAARENFSVPLWAGITAEQQERVVETVRAALGVPRSSGVGHPVLMRSPVNRHRLWQVGVDAGLIVAAWVLAWYLRFEGARRPVYYDRYLEWDVVALVLAVKVPDLRRLRLLQPLVALRVDAGHVGRGAWRRRRRPSPPSSSSRCSTSTPRASRAASGSSTSSSCSPS